MSALLEKRYFNVDEYYRMAEAGVLKQVIEVYAAESAGRYRKSFKCRSGETVKAETITELSLAVDDILGLANK